MSTWEITHAPFSSCEPHVVAEDLDDAQEAREALQARAARQLKRHPGCDVTWDDDGLGYELTDDTAAMVGNYQGRTRARVRPPTRAELAEAARAEAYEQEEFDRQFQHE